MSVKKKPILPRLVRIFAARSAFDFVIKVLTLVIAVNVMNIFESVYLSSEGLSPLHVELQAATFVSLPFVTLGVALVTHLDRLQSELRVMASTDMLTGLPNRRAFFEAAAGLDRHARSAVVILADIDHFKRINDQFGHDVGDACLKLTADALRAWLPRGGLICRFGGEEFAMVILGHSPGDIMKLGRSVASGVSLSPPGEIEQFNVTLSAGAAFWGADQPIDDAVRAADRALYEAKAMGRARLCFPLAA